VKSFYYITDAQADWPPERQDLWLQKFNYALADISAHEVRRNTRPQPLHAADSGKVRRIWIGLNPFLAFLRTGRLGHYAEQLMSDEGFKRRPRYRLAQTSEALTRICRLIAGTPAGGEWTIDQAAALFEREAHLPAPAALRKSCAAPTTRLRRIFPRQDGRARVRRTLRCRRWRRFSLREFHERVMTGIAPWWAHRQLLLPGDTRPVVN
jgi:hypothetical protein